MRMLLASGRSMKLLKNSSKFALYSILMSTTLALSSSCSLLVPDRAYMEEMNRESDPFFLAGRDFPVVGGDSGEAFRSKSEIKKRTPASERQKKKEKEELSIKDELAQKEADLGDYELSQYVKDKRYLPSDSDKLYYLSLSGGDRENYIRTRIQEVKEDQSKDQEFIERRSVHATEIYLGMEKNDVVRLWGKPARVEVAGNPKNQNERWSFVEDGSVKQVYFESGKVQGWALDL
jgi:hypothetical protein